MIALPTVLLAALAGSNYLTIVFAQAPSHSVGRVPSSTSQHPPLRSVGCCFGSSHAPFRFHSSGCSFLASLINQAPLPTRSSCPPSSSALRFKKVLASLYKLGFAFGLASTVQSLSVGTPSLAPSLFFFAIGFLRRRSRLLRPPETPFLCSLQSHSFLSGVRRRLLLGSPAIPFAAALRLAVFSCFLRSRKKPTKASLVFCLRLWRFAPASFGRASKPQTRPTTEVAPAPP